MNRPLSLLIGLSIPIAQIFAGPADDAWNAYLSGNFAKVDSIASAALADTSLTRNETARVYLALGCSDGMRGRQASAATAFERALMIDNSIQLTPSDLPPPVWKIFQPVFERLAKARSDSLLAAKTTPKTIVVRDTVFLPSPSKSPLPYLSRSLIWPGWGHIKAGNRRGWLFTIGEAAAVGGLVWSALATDRARDDYLRARTPDETADKYRIYDRYYRQTWGFALTAAAIYSAAQYDFLFSQTRIKFVGISNGGASIRVAVLISERSPANK